ncbi:hypothetical protein DIPPA_06220 [Diplonema papillatum]|nr:hypothetical protein DIPPA_06220 [Diplonema papillatum]
MTRSVPQIAALLLVLLAAAGSVRGAAQDMCVAPPCDAQVCDSPLCIQKNMGCSLATADACSHTCEGLMVCTMGTWTCVNQQGTCALDCNGRQTCRGMKGTTTSPLPVGMACEKETKSCDISCTGESSCGGVTSYCASEKCGLKCGADACPQSRFGCNNKPHWLDPVCKFECEGAVACAGSTFDLAGGDTPELLCSGVNSCQGTTVSCPGDGGSCTIICLDAQSCAGMTVDCPASAARCSIRCFDPLACEGITHSLPTDLSYPTTDAPSTLAPATNSPPTLAPPTPCPTAAPATPNPPPATNYPGTTPGGGLTCTAGTCNLLCMFPNSCQAVGFVCGPGTGRCNLMCSPTGSCMSSRLHCDATESCVFDCSGYESCAYAQSQDASVYDWGYGYGLYCGNTAASCRINCDAERACAEQADPMYCGAEVCEIVCNGNYSCTSTTSKCANSAQCTVQCSDPMACLEHTFDAAAAGYTNILCTNEDSCHDSTVICPLYADCRVECLNTESCRNMRVVCPYFQTGHTCTIVCGGINSCRDMTITGEHTLVVDPTLAPTPAPPNPTAAPATPAPGPFSPFCVDKTCTFACPSEATCGAQPLHCAASVDDCAAECVAARSCFASQFRCEAQKTCAIRCMSPNACSAVNDLGDGSGHGMYCGEEAEACTVVCGAPSACRGMAQPAYCASKTCDTYCNGVDSCRDSENVCANGAECNVHCSYPGSCANHTFAAWEAGVTTVRCTNTGSCSGATVICPENAECMVQCLNADACVNLKVACPLSGNACRVQCRGESSCNGLLVFGDHEILGDTPTPPPGVYVYVQTKGVLQITLAGSLETFSLDLFTDDLNAWAADLGLQVTGSTVHWVCPAAACPGNCPYEESVKELLGCISGLNITGFPSAGRAVQVLAAASTAGSVVEVSFADETGSEVSGALQDALMAALLRDIATPILAPHRILGVNQGIVEVLSVTSTPDTADDNGSNYELPIIIACCALAFLLTLAVCICVVRHRKASFGTREELSKRDAHYDKDNIVV